MNRRKGVVKVREILKATKGRLVSGNPYIDIDPSKISTDSRAIARGGLFIALEGPNFNGNDFVKMAFKKGAIGALVTNSKSAAKNDSKIVIRVKDGTKALQDIARHHRMKFDIPVIGVTGSNGKTTTKEMIGRVLSMKYNVLKNEGTKNNHIGVPQTLLKLQTRHDVCILEMGMNHKGEIALLADIAKPTIALILNIGPSHLEFLSGLKAVFKAKKEILKYLKKGDLCILNGDDKFLSTIKKGRFDILKFGLNKRCDFMATDISITDGKIKFILNGQTKFKLNLLGTSNIYNALAAIAVGSRLKIGYESMSRALENYEPGYMRLNLKEIGGIMIIDDSYNSNPLSMECALKTLKGYPANSRWVVSGDMLELGRYATRFHKILGESIARVGAEGLLTLGRLSKITLSWAGRYGMERNRLWHCSSHGEAARILKKVTSKGDAVLIKGSRAMRMEEVLRKFEGLLSSRAR